MSIQSRGCDVPPKTQGTYSFLPGEVCCGVFKEASGRPFKEARWRGMMFKRIDEVGEEGPRCYLIILIRFLRAASMK